ncbi:unnamed protein product [Rotaria sordida]|uniref:PARG catalytic Macro domain-containing protein n=1 Tax=Rotaria sordida TaxID=392033 RepID=A0A819NBB8_9BILA|nr:unnamed protein product [Rotaria sordida]
MKIVERELLKAYTGFRPMGQGPEYEFGIATGNWGCGAFNGDRQMKAIIQLMAASVAKRPLIYAAYGDKKDESRIGKCASETSERWANISAHIDEQIMDLSRDVDRLTTIDEQFVYIYVNIDGNRQLYFEIKRLHDRLDDYHRTENLMHAKIDEQDINLNQLRKELKQHLNMTNASKKIGKFENDIIVYTNEKLLFQQTIQKLEKQLTILQTQNQSLELNSQSYHEKSNEYESLLISLKEANENSLHLLEQTETELYK